MLCREFCEKALQESFNKNIGKVMGSQIAEGIHTSEAIPTMDIELEQPPTSEVAKLMNNYIEQKQTLMEVFDKASICDTPSEVWKSKDNLKLEFLICGFY